MKKLLLIPILTLVLFSCRKASNDNGGNSYNLQPLGYSAHDMLSAEKYSAVDIEIQYMPGYKLQDASVANLKAFLESLCNKPGGFNISQTEIAAAIDTLDPDKVAEIERKSRTVYTNGNRIGLYILVTSGVDTSVSTLGFAYRNTSLCIFGKTIANFSDKKGYLSRMALESGVLEHEIGHILGLLNNGSPLTSQHEDPDHQKHCVNENCLMYYSIELNSLDNIVHPNRIPVLDANCLADLRANGAK